MAIILRSSSRMKYIIEPWTFKESRLTQTRMYVHMYRLSAILINIITADSPLWMETIFSSPTYQTASTCIPSARCNGSGTMSLWSPSMYLFRSLLRGKLLIALFWEMRRAYFKCMTVQQASLYNACITKGKVASKLLM